MMAGAWWRIRPFAAAADREVRGGALAGGNAAVLAAAASRLALLGEGLIAEAGTDPVGFAAVGGRSAVGPGRCGRSGPVRLVTAERSGAALISHGRMRQRIMSGLPNVPCREAGGLTDRSRMRSKE
jgi:hypothetical protein